jgi:RNA-directed DNA polymerase
MNASACALSDAALWNSIDWAKVETAVKRLQMRIAKATREGKPGKVKALQWLLTHSFYAKLMAIKRVTGNRGKNSPGVDRVTWSSATAKWQGVLSLRTRGYKAKPLRRVNIPKANGKQRPLGIPTMKDRAMQALYRLALEPIAETTADHHSYGFRPERCTADAIEACYNVLCHRFSVSWILEADILGCFDNIRHDWLLANIPLDKRMLRQWLKAGFIEGGRLFPTKSGTPQGGIISPMLANMTLDGLQTAIESRFRKKNNGDPRYRVIRYADDFIVTGPSKELLEQEVMPVIEAFLQERGLALSQDKTRITHIQQGFDFLGQTMRKYNRKLLTKPSRKNMRTFLNNIYRTILQLQGARTEEVIAALNPKIRGWANYHRFIVAKRAFARIDHCITGYLWRWAVKRHPHKNKRWIRIKYFKSVHLRNWVFAVQVLDSCGNRCLKTLHLAADVRILRHIKIRKEAHPFNPESQLYLQQRRNRTIPVSIPALST